jgi:hypothetical protein
LAGALAAVGGSRSRCGSPKVRSLFIAAVDTIVVVCYGVLQIDFLGGALMETKRNILTFDVSNQVAKLINQRAAQEGITRSDYLREAVYLEFLLSGDLEATSFVGKRVGARIRDVITAKLRPSNVKEQVAQLIAAEK